MDDRVSKEMKLAIAKELVSSFVRGEAGKHIKPEQLGEVFKTVYQSLDDAFPEPEQRRIGLG
ncbi:MAG: hypothetical protein VKJ04_09195 [Vampirovibrionales bacterium]|nr:hypothetical protein [Vampirovibrionales bacterium]